jgi:hypothetical protein
MRNGVVGIWEQDVALAKTNYVKPAPSFEFSDGPRKYRTGHPQRVLVCSDQIALTA